MLFCLPLMTGTKLLIVVLRYVPSFLTKLRQLNINEFLLKWIVDYLTGRSQCIGVEGTTSLPQTVLSGVSQGSVLGPLLYIDGLTNVLSNSSMSLYADDLLLYRTIQSLSDYQTIQAEVDALSECMLVTRRQWHRKDFLIGGGGGGAQFETTYYRVVSNLYNLGGACPRCPPSPLPPPPPQSWFLRL